MHRTLLSDSLHGCPTPRRAALRTAAPIALRTAVPTALLAMLLLLLVIAPPLRAQATADPERESPRGTIEGVVRASANGLQLEGATVEVLGTRVRSYTDARGRFVLSGVPVGFRTLRVDLLGHGPEEREVDVPAGGRVFVEVELDTRPVTLDPVAVLVHRTRMIGSQLGVDGVPGSAHFIDRRDIQERMLPFENVHHILRDVPGVNVQDEDGYGLRPNIGLRGTGVERSSRITLMEDGVLIAPAPYASPSAYYFPVAGRMEAIEVRKGSSQIQYGPRTIGGAVNLVSSSIPDRLTWSLDLSGGENSTLRGLGRVGDSGENWGWMLETYQIHTDGFKSLPGDGDTGFRIQDYLAKLRWNTDRDAGVYQEVELKLGYTDEISNETYLGLTQPDFERTPFRRYPASQPDVMDAEHSQIQLRHFLRPSRSVDVTTTAYRNDFARNWYKLNDVRGTGVSTILDRPDDFAEELDILRGADSEADALTVRANNREYYSQGIQTVLGLRDAGGRVTHDVEVGVRFHRDQEDRFQLEDGYRMVDGRMVLTRSGEPGSQSNRVSDAEALALYVQDEIRVGRWTLSPGLRYETIDFTRTDFATDDPDRTAPTRVRENGVDAWIPGIGVSWEAAADLDLFGGVHRGFAPPGPGADEAAEPEESVSWEVGGRVRRGSVAAQVVGFYSDYENVLGRATLATGGGGSGEEFNGGAVDVRGVEASVDWDPAYGRELSVRLPVRVAYTWTQAEFGTSFESAYDPWGEVEPGDELPYLAEHQFSGSVAVEEDAWSVRLSAFGSSEMRTVAGQGAVPVEERIDGFVVWGLGGEYRLPGWGTALYASVQNLADEHYVVARRPAGARPGLPRTFTSGVRVTW